MATHGPPTAPEAGDRFVRRLALQWHRQWAASPARARLYGRGLRVLRRWLPDRAARHLANNIGGVDWPDVDLPAETVRMGARSVVRFHPHFGEFDIEALVRRRLSHEDALVRFLEARIASYDVVIEIGANVGVFTVFLADAFSRSGRRDAVIYAFEPSREAFRRLLANLRANGPSRVFPFNAAVGAETGVVHFHEPRGHLTNGSLRPDFAALFSAQVTSVPVMCLSGTDLMHLVPEHGRVLLKLDVEGAEAEVLESLAVFIAARGPDIVLEVLPGFEPAIAATTPLRSGRFLCHEITDAGPVRRPALRAGRHRDWWLQSAVT